MPSPSETFLRALDELVIAHAKGDELGMRQAAEKAWLSVVEGTDEFLSSKHSIRVNLDERSHVERRRILHAVNRTDLEREYGYLAQTLHGDVFYIGDGLNFDTLRKLFEEAADYVEQTTGKSGLVETTKTRLA